MNQLKQKFLALTPNHLRAFLAILLIAVSATIVAFAIALRLVADPNLYWYSRIAVVTTIPLAVISFLGAYLILKGRPIQGGLIFIAGLTIALLAFAATFTGFGFMAAAIAVLLFGYIGLQVLPQRFISWSFAYGLLIGANILIIDVYVPWPRASLIGEATISWMGVILVVMYGFAIIRQFRSIPLQTKLILSSLFFTIVPVAALGILASQTATGALETSANQSLSTSASQVAASVDTFILNNLDVLRVEAQTPDFIEYLELPEEERAGSAVEQRVNSILRSLRQKDTIYILSYALVSRRAVVVADTNPDNLGKWQSNQMYFVESMNTGVPYVSPVQISENSPESVILFSAPVRNASGATVGVLRVTYKADILQLLLVQQGSSEGVNTMLVDDNFITLANREYPDLMRKSILPLDEARVLVLQRLGIFPEGPVENLEYPLPELVNGLKNLDAQPNFSGEFHSDEQVSLEGEDAHSEQAAAVRTTTRPWYVVAMQSRQDLLAPVSSLARAITVLGVITSFAGALLAGLIAGLISRPIEDLSETAGRLAGGDLSARAEVSGADEIGQLGVAFNNMSDQLSGLINSLEQRVNDRTRALATSTEVSRHLSTILDESELVKEVVEQLQKAFDYYHVHIYLYDDNQENLVMVGGTGDVGQTMLARGHQISKGRGLVGRAAETGVPVLVSDVSKADGWLPNPLLPYTRSEMAVPILAGDRVLGVLDVQDDEVGALQQSDADLLQSIANQVGIGLLNARSYKETQRRAQREAIVAAIGQQILQTTSTQEALQVAVREVGRALGKPNTMVRLKAKSGAGQMEEPVQQAENNGHENGRG